MSSANLVGTNMTEEKMTTKQVEAAAAMFAAKGDGEDSKGKAAATPTKATTGRKRAAAVASDEKRKLGGVDSDEEEQQEAKISDEAESEEEEAPKKKKKKQKKKTATAKAKKAPARKKEAQAPLAERLPQFANGVHISHKNFQDPKMHGDIWDFDPEDGQYKIIFNREGPIGACHRKKDAMALWIGPEMMMIEKDWVPVE